MMRYCEECFNNYETEREDASEYFCPKCCIIKLRGDGDGLERY